MPLKLKPQPRLALTRKPNVEHSQSNSTSPNFTLSKKHSQSKSSSPTSTLNKKPNALMLKPTLRLMLALRLRPKPLWKKGMMRRKMG